MSEYRQKIFTNWVKNLPKCAQMQSRVSIILNNRGVAKMGEKLFSIEEVAQLLGVSCVKIKSAIESGLLDICKKEEIVYVPIEALKSYVLTR